MWKVHFDTLTGQKRGEFSPSDSERPQGLFFFWQFPEALGLFAFLPRGVISEEVFLNYLDAYF